MMTLADRDGPLKAATGMSKSQAVADPQHGVR